MITPAEIRKKAARHYSTFLAAVLTRERFFPFHIKGNKGKVSDGYEKLFRGIKKLLEGEKQQLGYGYTVTLKPVNTRDAGKISMPDAIFFENVEDYVKYIDKEEEFLQFRKAVQFTHKTFPALKKWMAANPLKVVKYLDKWENIVKTTLFLAQNPQSAIFSRAILDIPATFVEDHQKILAEILEEVLPKVQIQSAHTDFESRYGLKKADPLLEARSLPGYFLPFSIAQLALPISDWNNLNIHPKKVFIVSDRLNFLRFPASKDALVIWGHSDILPLLSQLTLLKNAVLYFWGNISVKGFEQLALLRSTFPAIQSLFMNTETLRAYESFVETVNNQPDIYFPHLNTPEQQTLKEVLIGKRLHQKHILQKDLEEQDSL